jgi:hypothetical protein
MGRHVRVAPGQSSVAATDLEHLSRVKEGAYKTVTSMAAGRDVLGLPQEFRLVPLVSVGSSTWC